MKRPLRLAHALLLVALGTAPLRANVTLAPLFTDGAVLQREKPIPVWGRADPGERVTVTFAEKSQRATAGADGRWIVFLEPLPANSTGADLIVTGKNSVTVRDVLVGEVWLCSGQSNMEWPVRRALEADREMAAANFPLIRHVALERRVAEQPADTASTGGWKTATPANVGSFTAVGYFFARDIHRKLDVPVGLVHSSWGGTPVESWMSAAAIASDPAFAVVLERWQQARAEYPAKRAAFEQASAEWTTAEAAAKAAGEAALAAFRKESPRPRSPRGAPGDTWTPAGLFNGMINPLLPYGLRGVLWYQGESNADRASEYRALFNAMITAWRAHFGQGDIPFFWVSLANWEVPFDPSRRTWAFLREAQTQTLALPNTGQALAIDIGDAKDLHPPNKQEVGRRLALLARNRVYAITCDDTGPTFAGATREGNALRVRFTAAGGGLIAREKPPQALEVAGADRVFHPATGKIERDTLLVSSPAVKEPVAVRYSWTNAPEANLYNGAGLPAVPFRTDNW